MAAIPVGGSTAPTPSAHTTDPKADSAPKRPGGEDGKAAKTAPGETTTAVQNTFGKVPGGSKQPDTNAKNSNAKQPGNGAKAPADNPKAGSDAPKTPVDNPKAGTDAPKDAPAPGDAAAPKEGAAPDGKTASPDAGAAKQAATPQPDQPATTPPANDAKQPAADTDGPKSSIFYGANDPKRSPGDYAKTADGKDYAKTADGKYYIKYNENNNAVAVDDKGSAVQDPNGNPYAINDKGEFATTANDRADYIVYDKSLGGNAVSIDFLGNRIDDGSGNPRVIKPDGNYALTADGKAMVYPQDAGGKIAALKVTDSGNTLFKGPQEKVFLVRPDGTYALTVDNKYMAYDPSPNGKYVAVSGGAVSTDPKGRAYVVKHDGSYMQPEDGKFGVLNKYDKIVASDAATGEVVKDANGHAYVLDNDGKYMQPEAGKFAVYNEQTGKTIATDGKGNPVTDASGNPYLVGDDGKYVKTADGNYAVYTPKLAVKDLTLYRNEKQEEMVTADGLSLYQDKTGKFVGVSNSGVVVEIDPVSGKMVTDPATGNPIVLNDPYAERPLGTDNMNVIDTLAKMPQGVERGDPMAIKTELFKDGVLDKESLYAALGKYDSRDVYDALVNASKYGGWNNAPAPKYGDLVHPDAATARMLIAGMIAWQNDNGGYKPLKEGEMPLLAAVNMAVGPGGYTTDAKDAYVNTESHGNQNLFNAAGVAYHELNHATESDAFIQAVKEGWAGILGEDNNEAITEYLANKWTQNKQDTLYDKWGHMESLDNAVRALGGGNVDVGTDILRRAYYQGDPVATKLFLAAINKEMDAQRGR